MCGSIGKTGPWTSRPTTSTRSMTTSPVSFWRMTVRGLEEPFEDLVLTARASPVNGSRRRMAVARTGGIADAFRTRRLLGRLQTAVKGEN